MSFYDSITTTIRGAVTDIHSYHVRCSAHRLSVYWKKVVLTGSPYGLSASLLPQHPKGGEENTYSFISSLAYELAY